MPCLQNLFFVVFLGKAKLNQWKILGLDKIFYHVNSCNQTFHTSKERQSRKLESCCHVNLKIESCFYIS